MKEPKPRRKFGVILRILSAKNKKICWAPKKFYFLQIFIFTKKITQTGQFIFVIHHGMRQIHKIIEIYRIITSPMKCKWKTLSIFYKIKKNSTFTYFQNTKKKFPFTWSNFQANFLWSQLHVLLGISDDFLEWLGKMNILAAILQQNIMWIAAELICAVIL